MNLKESGVNVMGHRNRWRGTVKLMVRPSYFRARELELGAGSDVTPELAGEWG